MRARLNDRDDGNDRGISLIEMVVAVLVLSIGVIAGFRTLGQAQVVIGGEMPRLLAQNVALNRAEELQILGGSAGNGLPRQVRMGGIDWTVDVTQAATEGGFAEATIRVTAPDQPGAVYVVYAPLEPPR